MSEETDLKKYIKEKFPDVRDKKQIAFFIKFIITGKAQASYMAVYPDAKKNSASVLACNLLKNVNFTASDWLDFAGHTIESVTEALDSLKQSNPDAYLKHVIKLKQLDVQKIEHTGAITIPDITIITGEK